MSPRSKSNSNPEYYPPILLALFCLGGNLKQPEKFTSNTYNKHESSAVASSTKLERWALFAEIAGPVAGVMVACESDPEVLNQTSWARCSNYYFMQFNGWEYLYYQHDDKSIPAQLWIGADAYFKQQVRANLGFSRFWSQRQIAFDEPFRSYVTAEFVAARAEQE